MAYKKHLVYNGYEFKLFTKITGAKNYKKRLFNQYCQEVQSTTPLGTIRWWN